jgi:hypothetical protein
MDLSRDRRRGFIKTILNESNERMPREKGAFQKNRDTEQLWKHERGVKRGNKTTTLKARPSRKMYATSATKKYICLFFQQQIKELTQRKIEENNDSSLNFKEFSRKIKHN